MSIDEALHREREHIVQQFRAIMKQKKIRMDGEVEKMLTSYADGTASEQQVREFLIQRVSVGK